MYGIPVNRHGMAVCPFHNDKKSYEKHEKDADRFIALIDKYENFDKLTIAMLNEFIEKILVHERDRKGSIHRPHRRSRFTSISLGDLFPRRLEKRS